ncbi:amino acid adenylation domain-containing protein [Cupriavidus basilensis]|uniref:Amino acid adenylation domain-containing protein n=1 Tax=Cupriavidus basilensis TaxID=68895 RepID=A0A643FVK6_9BURK|nr:amino acid adenylation domain-containing protein [Cupriavidus basilensis]QOT75837.1 amino acid adenylation domain-containing protein [Cupriavidus basilensis]
MLHSFFFDTAARQPGDHALWVDGRFYTYEELRARAGRVRAALAAHAGGGSRNCVLFAHRSVSAYAGLLGVLAAGMAYVPLHPRFPSARNAAIVERSGARVMLVDRACAPQLEALMPLLPPDLHVVLLDPESLPATGCPGGSARFAPLPPAPFVHDPPGQLAAVSGDDLAYLIFTSGTSGPPKGVMIPHTSAVAYVSAQMQRFPSEPGARFSQFADLTFDFSVHDMHVCWASGGCLYVPALQDPLYLAGFIQEHSITHWASVPSVLALMQQFRKLTPCAFPSVRMTLMGGEALPKTLARAWSRAAPNTRIVNGYGPTEATVIMLTFELTEAFLADASRPAVPLGKPYPGVELMVVDDALAPVPPGARGELLIGGAQLAKGYLGANPLDAQRFFTRAYPERACSRWYRTGDAVAESPDGLLYHGRIDMQVKIRGNRVELQEIEQVVQAASGGAQCAVLAWPLDNAGKPTGLVAFVQASGEASSGELGARMAQIRQACRQSLPVYAQPDRIVCLDGLPMNVNGKIDRGQLLARCERLAIGAGDARQASRKAFAP